jgi:hypothetical protein
VEFTASDGCYSLACTFHGTVCKNCRHHSEPYVVRHLQLGNASFMTDVTGLLHWSPKIQAFPGHKTITFESKISQRSRNVTTQKFFYHYHDSDHTINHHLEKVEDLSTEAEDIDLDEGGSKRPRSDKRGQKRAHWGWETSARCLLLILHGDCGEQRSTPTEI